MIRRTLAATQAATFAVNLPEPLKGGLPYPTGTGFFVSPDGLFVTARHVLTDDEDQLRDLNQCVLTKELRGAVDDEELGVYCRPVGVAYEDAETDLAVLRVDFARYAGRRWLEGASGFPWIRVSTRTLDDAEPVYSFGYPLSYAELHEVADGGSVGSATLHPRVTSAIVASTIEASGIVTVIRGPAVYVLDKALNYGNSGGPIVAQDTGHAHAMCTRFQHVYIPQTHLEKVSYVMIPSLYGVVTSLADPSFLDFLKAQGADVADE